MTGDTGDTARGCQGIQEVTWDTGGDRGYSGSQRIQGVTG